ncbi:hypothetical protein COS55_01670 [Candidatus Shapirobacteria bacterium CG03_land_8_20_14_0_80_40_19]|uniref:Uncharacterized protein n=4 Tax=Candidatus Shapironibacteriota TaxID=1752721 RepID=A0A2M7BED3_9BACT|nr:MAG: hypothetical protein COV89_00730 [Candidatus Shapirobacteria bacterium CG11_big_fil_rev_8_21_14_0_20_40_12]PIV01502.1 MAG: hypothetical protein COS55_01670 [Candidatus Shapirobacteria bacterium CG03_land_8_20_14_0_80_40_19]PJC28929.1 MAG: hypothetical protein CO053_01985 [Candidatus Shapirobacteria bacterium CG_4_9_14_0_2_um_filter_40_11]PJC76031.1 MAG: hypothetical protein CO010_03785 [Candidatus Shapirobacteria bacterium CG_4_8_14_3_um_filter_39_11]
MADQDNIQDGEIVTNQATSDFLNLESLIKSYVAKIDLAEKELREKNQMLKDAFESDAVYKEHADKAKEANRIKSATKQQILKQPNLAELNERIKDIKFDVNEQQAVLTDYLSQYQQQTGANQIEVGDGEVMDIITVVKLSRRPKNR